MSVYVFGVDPGLASFGWATLVVPDVGKPRVVAGDVIETSPKQDAQRRFRAIEDEVRSIFKRYISRVFSEDFLLVAASEDVSGWDRRIKNMIDVHAAWHRFDAVCSQFSLTNFQVHKATWKAGLGLKKTATKKQVEDMVHLRTHSVPMEVCAMSGGKRNHIFDAAAIALYAASSLEFKQWRQKANDRVKSA